jgi:hypothetical protein
MINRHIARQNFKITNLSPAIVKKEKTCWTPTGHVKVTFSLFLERISQKYESFECLFTRCRVTLQLIKFNRVLTYPYLLIGT